MYIDGARQTFMEKPMNKPDTFDEIIKLKDEYSKRIKDEGQKLLKEHFTKLFALCPELEAVRWEQYTPYFNDGDPCEFSVHDWTVRMAGATGDADLDDDFDYIPYKPQNPVYKTIQDFEAAVPEEVLEVAFGDHVQITATREGFEVEEYSHD